MSKEFEFVGGECHRALLDHFVGDGYDSRVYKNGDMVKRVYVGSGPKEFSPPGARTLSLYWEITNKAHEMFKDKPLVVNFPFSNEQYDLKFNPFIRMYRCLDCGYIEADSPYIPGHNLSVISGRFDQRELRVVLKNLSHELEDRFEVRGINLESVNLKSPEHRLLIVTDMCSSVAELKRNWWQLLPSTLK
ncbi:MAG: hypothetical protein HYV90_04710 [Candidatus Woesebacteria bacterium]|nr:MAG: hypothetical protein HYV90_04710 [Candidatus Woesebacteria bacterium]